MLGMVCIALYKSKYHVCLERQWLAMYLRETRNADLKDILLIEREAFTSDREANLAKTLLTDPTAKPVLSLMAFIDGQPAGHILFTKALLLGSSREAVVSFLAPLAVVPKFQRQGVGGRLVKEGLERLLKLGVDLVFVVGHPQYYPKHGFAQADKLGFETPFPIPEEHADAWMVCALNRGLIGSVSGKVVCCDALNKPELWQE
jgi:putative acetyltransferase